MQMEGLRSGDLAMQRTLVVVKAQEMMERMRSAHPATLQAYLAVFETTSAKDNGCNVSGTVCNTTQIAEHDIFWWQTELEAIVPVLTSSTALPSVGNSVTVAIDWEERGVAQSYSVTTVLADNLIYSYE